MKKLIIIDRDLSNLNTGGRYYLAQVIAYFKKKNLSMEIIDCSKFPKAVKKNRLFFIVYILKFYLKYRKGIFNFVNHGLHFYLLVPYFVSRIMGNKYGVGGHLAMYTLRKNLLMKWIEFLCEYIFLQGSSLIIIPSKAAVNQFKVFHLERKNKIIINPVPQIVGQGNIIFRKQIHKLIFAGHVEWRKGLDILIKALSKLEDLHLHLDVAGLYDVNSKYSKEIQKIINEYELNNNVFFHGYVSPETLAHLYKNSDLFVFPSRHETFGMVLVEAMSFGLPIVASSIPTTVEIIKDKVNGILYETEDADALAEAIRKVAYDSDLRYSIIQNNVKLSKKFRNWEDVGNENFNAILPFLNK